MNSQNVKERREHTRYSISSQTSIFTFGGLANLMDISLGGFSVEYLDGGLEPDSKYNTNFLVCNDRYCIKNLPIKIAWVGENFVCSNSKISLQQVGVKFNAISTAQIEQLEKFIYIYSDKELLS